VFIRINNVCFDVVSSIVGTSCNSLFGDLVALLLCVLLDLLLVGNVHMRWDKATRCSKVERLLPRHAVGWWCEWDILEGPLCAIVRDGGRRLALTLVATHDGASNGGRCVQVRYAEGTDGIRSVVEPVDCVPR